MAQRIVTICDVCQNGGEDATGRPFDIAIRQDGARFRFLTVDLCERHAKPLEDVFLEAIEVGREFDGDPLPVKTKRTRVAAKADGPFVCHDCNREFSAPQGLARHRTTIHRDAGRADG